MLYRYLLAPLAALLLLAAPHLAQAQTGGVGIGTTTPEASAALDVSSTSKGLLPPRLSQAQRDAISSPATGLTVYNTTTNKLNTWNGTSWDAALSATEQSTQAAATVFTYTGSPQTYTVPATVTQVTVEANGAQGGNDSYYAAGLPGGLGAQVRATLAVVPGQVLTVYVGGVGESAPGPGGYNGGGRGYLYTGSSGSLYSGGGGGASDVRTSASGTAYTGRLLVAGGGGGSGFGTGGAGGAPNGSSGKLFYSYIGSSSGTGATGTAGGSTGGTWGQGGSTGIGGGGGGGYYGGGGGNGSDIGGPGGGGSSWVGPTGNSISMAAGVRSGDGLVSITPGPAYVSPALDGTNFVNVPGTWQVNGSDVYRAAGNVGIGTSTPGQKLDVAGNANVSGNGYVGGSVGIGTSTPAASAALDVSSTSKGLLPPRLTLPQRNAMGTGSIAAPATGLTIYNTTDNKLNTWNGTSWDAALSATEQAVPYPNATFYYTGGEQTYIVPTNVTSLVVDAMGAPGGGSAGPPGRGARVQTTLAVTPGEVLRIYVGSGGGRIPQTVGGGGYNGGGACGGTYYGGGGGGATDIRRGGAAFTNRIVVAGGGGGDGDSGQGGNGGGPTGNAGGGGQGGQGGTPSAGGTGFGDGAFFQGGSATSRGGGGGGGGWYGGGAGGGGGNDGGGGGSSYVTPVGSSGTVFSLAPLQPQVVLSPGTAYGKPALDGTNFVNVPGTFQWTVSGNDLYRNSGSVGIGTTGAPDNSAALEVKSTTKGLLPPRLTLAQRDAIASPATGLTVYNTTTTKLNTWNGTSWDAAISASEQTYQGPAVTFGYTGGPQTYTVPAGVLSLQVDAVGASGGGNYNGLTGDRGGAGGRVQATLAVTPGQVLTLYVGGAGGFNVNANSTAAGGYNGGGGATYGGAGGGATDVRSSGGQLADRLLVAGGGGGGGYYGNTYGGAGGDPNGRGYGGQPFHITATAGSQTAGGSAGGGLGTGGAGDNISGGGGGGGYYGGGGGSSPGGGGGGSSWVATSGISGVNMTAGGGNAGDGSLTLTPGPQYASPVLNGGNFVNVPGDNLGNHTATQNLNLGTNALVGTTAVNVGSPLNLGTNQLVGNGGSSGLAISSTGNVGIGTTGPATTLDVRTTDSSAAITVGKTDASAGALYFGNPNHGLKRNYSGGNDVGLFTTAGNLYLSAAGNTSTSQFVLQNGGSVGIGTTPAGGLHIDLPEVGSNSALGVTIGGGTSGNPSLELRGANNALPYLDFAETSGVDFTTRLISQGGVLTVNGSANGGLLFQVNGNVQATNVTYTSDQRFKQHIRPIGGALASVLALRGVRYEWNALGVQHGGTAGAGQIGVIAQEVEAIFPELVSTGPDGFKSVNYAQLAPAFIEAFKEQQAQIEALKAQNAAAHAELQTVKAQATTDKTQATTTLETFEARLRQLEASSAQAQR